MLRVIPRGALYRKEWKIVCGPGPYEICQIKHGCGLMNTDKGHWFQMFCIEMKPKSKLMYFFCTFHSLLVRYMKIDYRFYVVLQVSYV